MEIVKTSNAERERALRDFIDRLVAELRPLQLGHHEALWMASITGEAFHEEESARLDTQIRKVFARREPYEYLSGVAAAGGVEDALLGRQLKLLVDQYRAHQIAPERIERMVQIEKGLESRFNNFRASLDGERVSDNRIRDILRDSDDSELRRRAWEASKQIGAEVVSDLVSLVELRNEAARSLGFDHYYVMSLQLDELDEAELFALLDRLEEGTRPLFRAYKEELDARLARRFGVAPRELRPWHYGDPFFQEAPAGSVKLDAYFADQSLEQLAERFFGAVGFDIRDLLERADLYEKPGKSQHAFCLSVDRGADVRVLCNLQPTEHWMGTLLHEFGHAVYDKYVDRSLPWLLRGPAHILSTEGSAMLFGRLSKSGAWLATYAGMPWDQAHAAEEALGRATRAQLLVQTRWMLVMTHMERALYRNPRQDLDALWWDLVERFQWVRRPEARKAPDWASKIHFSTAPVYYHNYMLGEMTASQLQAHVLEHVVGGGPEAARRYVSSPEVGAFLIEELYRRGRTLDWRDTLRHATGRTLEAGAFVDELAGRA